MSSRTLEQAVEAIRRDGYVVIENVVPHEPLDGPTAPHDCAGPLYPLVPQSWTGEIQGSCEDSFPDGCGLDHNAEFIEGQIDYLFLNRG